MAFNITDFSNKWANFKEELKDYFNKRVVDKNGDTMSGELHILADPTTENSATTVKWVKEYHHPWTCDPSKPMETVCINGNPGNPTLFLSFSNSTYNIKNFSDISSKFYMINSGEIHLDFLYYSNYIYATSSATYHLYKNGIEILTLNHPSFKDDSNREPTVWTIVDTKTINVEKGDVLQLGVDCQLDGNKYSGSFGLSIMINTGSPYKYNNVGSGIITEDEV